MPGPGAAVGDIRDSIVLKGLLPMLSMLTFTLSRFELVGFGMGVLFVSLH